MQLILGPAGSGKTASVLTQVREALRSHDDRVRLLVPTATLEHHLQNQLAREGFVFRSCVIQTLSRFIQPWVTGLPEAPEAVLYLIVEEAARRVNRLEFSGVAQFPGFCAALARTIGELSSAGCDAARLAKRLPDAPLAPAFIAVYEEVEQVLSRRGLWLRAQRLAHAADRIEAKGASGIRTIWLDGFHALPDPEMRLIMALDRHAEVTLTLADGDFTESLRERLRAIGCREQRVTPARPTPAVALVRAASIERETEEIAHRILEQAAVGRPFREIGIIVRPAETYVPILRSTLDRFGIPARFYFDSRLEEHAAIRCLRGIVDAMLGGWDHAETLSTLRLMPRFADSNTTDRFEFDVRERIPNRGLAALRELANDAPQVHQQIDVLAAFDAWGGLTLTPREWARRLRMLRNVFRPATLAHPEDHETVLMLRSQAGALDAFDEALEEAALALDDAGTTLPDFWLAVKALLRMKPLRIADDRRDVVHVLSAHEARQWVLPVIFVCGMVEKQFPRFHRQDAFLPDFARAQLNSGSVGQTIGFRGLPAVGAAPGKADDQNRSSAPQSSFHLTSSGVHVRTAAEFENEERALFESAISRATLLTTLSYPEFDHRGERNLPSLFLASLEIPTADARAVRPKPRNEPAPARAVEVRSPALLTHLRQRTAKLSPSGLESYLQCAFQYFSMRTMRLKTTPARPEDRLDFMTQGNIVHDVLAKWWGPRGDVEPLFEATFERVRKEKSIPVNYHTERKRNAMLRDLIAFTTDPRWPAGIDSHTEKEFAFPLDESLTISGKIDRLDITPEGAHVTDYKYSASVKARLDNPNLLQGPLYLLAAERAFGLKATRMEYVGLKGEIQVVPVPLEEGSFERAIDRTRQAAEEIRAGRIVADPADPKRCRYCDCRDACRFETRKAVAETVSA